MVESRHQQLLIVTLRFPNGGKNILRAFSFFLTRADLTAPMSSSALRVRAVEYLEMGVEESIEIFCNF